MDLRAAPPPEDMEEQINAYFKFYKLFFLLNEGLHLHIRCEQKDTLFFMHVSTANYNNFSCSPL